jgi:ornithine carbamoyltransferase
MYIYTNETSEVTMHLLDIYDLRADQIIDIFEIADRLKDTRTINILADKTFILFFPESSLRTRITFEKGIEDLGGRCILFPPSTLDKREELHDVIKYLENWANGIIVRHTDFAKMKELAQYSTIPIINAMSSENHPCEIIHDLYAISKRREDYRELVYTFVGPEGNILKSWKAIAHVMDLGFHHVCPNGNEMESASHSDHSSHNELEEKLLLSDVVLTDSLPQELRTSEYISKYQITLQRMNLTKDNALLNPCPPFFRGEEVSDDVISSAYFVGHAFKKDLLYVQQAILLYCLRDGSVKL